MKVLNDKVRNIVFIVEGGIGKNIAATAVVKSIKHAYPTRNIIVLAGCPEVFFYRFLYDKQRETACLEQLFCRIRGDFSIS